MVRPKYKFATGELFMKRKVCQSLDITNTRRTCRLESEIEKIVGPGVLQLKQYRYGSNKFDK